MTNALVDIDSGYFIIEGENYYLKPELEDIFINKLTSILVEGASMNIKFENNRPVMIQSIGISDISKDNYGYHHALTTTISEDINDYIIPDKDDPYSFNKKIVRMISAIIGKKHCFNTYFGQDETLNMMLYSLSVDKDLFDNLNKELTLIEYLINTLNNNVFTKTDNQIKIINKLIEMRKNHLINIIIDELYIPSINNVGLDERKKIRDEILKGFLGANYINLKLTEENKESYYWASLINNTVPINNTVGEIAKAYFEEQIIKQDDQNMHDIYVMDAIEKTKKNIKEFFVLKENDKLIIKTGKRLITDASKIDEILSYAYINSIESSARKKLEQGLVALCSKGPKFKCSLKCNPLNNKMLIAAIIQLANKSGVTLKNIGNNNTMAEFEIKKRKETEKIT